MSIVDGTGSVVAEYEYDPYGNIISATGELAEVNPLRYRGYGYDQECNLYYLQSRYYDPSIVRFINADAYASTGQGIIGPNMFVYCLNNPVMMCDIGGFRAVINTRTMDGYVEPGSRYYSDGQEKRDVTDEVLSVLTEAATQARSMRTKANRYSIFDTKRWEIVGNIYTEFRSLVDHGKRWDIKLEDVWKSTIGTAFPGFDTEVIFAGNVMTPHSLGNFTYGYLGYSYGIPLEILIGGSYYAAGCPILLHDTVYFVPGTRYSYYDNSAFYNELEDWPYIIMGYEYAQNGYLD